MGIVVSQRTEKTQDRGSLVQGDIIKSIMGDYKSVPLVQEVLKQGIDAEKDLIENGEEKQEDETTKMSPLRKTAFVFSILFSVTLCCVFLWGLPCDMATCASKDVVNGSSTVLWTGSTLRPTEEM